MAQNTDLNNGRTLVLGSSGFIGRNLYEYLLDNGHDVVGHQYSSNYLDMINCDLTDFNLTKMLIKGNDYVFMMAAKTFGLGVLCIKPEKLVHENIVMNANVLQACYECGVKKVLLMSSSVVYQDNHKCLKEEDLDLNQQPYHLYQGVGWVKRYTEQLARFYSDLGMSVITVRPTNVYGKYDKLDETKSHFIPAIIKKCLNANGKLTVWGSGTNVKDYIYVDDFVQDIVELFTKYDSCEPLNMCSGELKSIREVVRTVADLCGFKGYTVYDKSKPETVAIKHISNEKINKIISRVKYTDFNQGLSRTIEWVKNEIASNSKHKA